jgi:2-polyprenyl-3-methyl-5-hydroxy-6-metoxy-1,4-benzoquinol methylase
VLVRTGVALMPYFPLPEEWYRKILVGDSEKRYATGRWNYLRDITESHRYSLIIGCADFYRPGERSILDVGCGEGILQKRADYSRYVGVDMNAEAIRLAQARSNARTEFVLAPAEKFNTEERFDVIVFNESLYYIPNPLAVFTQYRQYLADDGIVVVCMFQTNLARKIWKRLAAEPMVELTAGKISNELGFASIVKVFAKRPMAGAGTP